MVSTAICGASPCSISASSCQLESSMTTGVSGVIGGSWPSAETPMLPARTVVGSQARSMLGADRGRVVFPLVPVMPMIGAGQARKKRLISISTGTPAARAATSSGARRGTPGLRTTMSAPRGREVALLVAAEDEADRQARPAPQRTPPALLRSAGR